MPMVCQTCRRKDRAAIDAALVAGTSSRAIASRYGTSKSALDRHRPHASAAIVRAFEREGMKADASLLDQMRSLQARTLALLNDAEDAQDGRLRAVAISQVRENVQLLAKLTGELDETPTASVVLVWADAGGPDLRPARSQGPPTSRS